MRITLSLLGALGTVLAGSSQAAVIAGWTFDSAIPAVTDSTIGPAVAADIGSGTITGLHQSSESDWISYYGNGSAYCYSGGNWTAGDYYQFSTSTEGFEDITITLDQSAYPTGPRDFQFSYSTDGTNFTNFGDVYDVPRLSPSTGFWNDTTRLTNAIFSFDLSGIAALDDASTVYFRVTQIGNIAAGGGTVGIRETYIDNIMINGTAVVPEPAVTLLGAFGMLGLLRRRR